MGQRTVTCQGENCGAEIMFFQGKRGAMPVDAKETTVAVVDPEHPERPAKLVKGHVPHHISCPDANRFRYRDRT